MLWLDAAPDRGARFFVVLCSVLCLALTACDGETEAPQKAEVAAATDTVDAAALYQAACALCHGAEGDGQGVVVLDRPARSFKDGGFSFGNTPEAVLRTITNGIGGTPMPGFGTVYSEAELRALADYVIGLGPETVQEPGAASIVVVGDRPEFVRGQLDPGDVGGLAVPRGLVVGTPDGLTWVYDAGDVRLLAVRQGDFVDRTDWSGRGGTPLDLLGRAVTRDVVSRGVMARTLDGLPLWCRLVDAYAGTHGACVTYRAMPVGTQRLGRQGEALAIAGVSEFPAAAPARGPFSGFARRVVVSVEAEGVCLNLGVRFGPVERGADGTSWIVQVADGEARSVGVRPLEAEPLTLVEFDGVAYLRHSGSSTLSFDLTTLVLPDAKAETLTRWREEVL